LECLKKKLPNKVGLSQPEISRKENGLTAIDINQLKSFADALDVSIDVLLDNNNHSKAVGE
jgi:transcriptional regulator with XRE-family HTH domain